MRDLYTTLRKRMDKALFDFGMLAPGDRILVGVSGGADSLCLLQLLHDKFSTSGTSRLIACHVDLGFEPPETGAWKKLETYFQLLGVPYRIIHTCISSIALAPDAKKNPCFICSHNRRRKIYEIAHAEGCKKIAYGHHKDDIIETLLINILYGRRVEAMYPVQEVFKGKMAIVRPFTYVDETMLKRFAEEQGLPVLPRQCPVDRHSRRQTVKDLIQALQTREPHANIRNNIFRSLHHVNLPDSFKPGMQPEK